MKELIVKLKLESSNLSSKNTVNEINIFDERKITNEVNKFFTNVRSKLAIKIPNPLTTFESYINPPDFITETK